MANIAFALGGLAGNNAHGAGFLQAALNSDIKPSIISCTSGQIRWVSHYLSAPEHNSPKDFLRNKFMQELASIRKTGNINADVAFLAFAGIENVLRPSYEYLIPDLIRNATDAFTKAIHSKGNVLVAEQLLSLLPGRTLVPDFSESYFEEISKSFNNSDIGITFNSYDPQEGIEYVYSNDAAAKLLHDPSDPENYKANQRSEHRPYRFYKAIDTAAVKDALWLYQYGFYDKDSKFVDGAYFRDIMLAELVYADLIFSVRPINHKWIGELPRTYQGIEDIKTEIGFNGSYSAERDQIMLINKLLAKKYLDHTKGRGFHHIDLIELEITMQRGYFDYMMESQEVFDASEKIATAKFEELASVNKL